MSYSPMGRFLDVVWSGGPFFGFCMAQWVFLDVVWPDGWLFIYMVYGALYALRVTIRGAAYLLSA